MNIPGAYLIGLLAALWAIGNSVRAGETKNEVIFDCDKTGDNPITCTACNIYHEARGEATPGQWLVALATKNRVDGNLYPFDNAGPKADAEGFENQYCKVVYEQRKDRRSGKWVPMFSWTRDGKHDRVYNKARWTDAMSIAAKLIAAHEGLLASVPDITYGCQWYHRTDITPYWKSSYHPTVVIGNHQCYAKNEKAYLAAMSKFLPGIMQLDVKAEMKLSLDTGNH